MITSDGWFDWADKIVVDFTSPTAKVWPDRNSLQGFIPHSADGSFDVTINIMKDPKSGRLVHGVVAYDGRFVQFCPVFSSPWASGSHTANRIFVAVEHEGGFPGNESEPLRQAQINADIRIIRDLQTFKNVGSNYWRRPVNATDQLATLVEHRECTRYGSLPTACPSNRIPWNTILSMLGSNPVKDGWIKEGTFWVFYNDGVPVERKGSTDPNGPKGRSSFNFGDVWQWERHIRDDGTWDPIGFLSPEEGD